MNEPGVFFMNVPQEQLDRWRRMLGELRGELNAALFVAHPVAAGPVASSPVAAADDIARRLALDMERAGADIPADHAPRPAVPLTLLDTPANRRYAEKLREAWEAGLAVDRERYGPGIGTDGCAQMIEMVLADVEEELHGPAGARE